MSDLLRFTAIVRPQKAESLVRELLACEGVDDCHAVEVRGSGNQSHAGSEVVLGFLPKVAVSGLVEPDALEELIQLIQASCPTGRSGDGKFFVQPIGTCIDLDPHREDV